MHGNYAKQANDELMLELVQRNTFQWFLDCQDKSTGLTYDRSNPNSFATIAGVGFALTCYPIAVKRRWITRDDAVEYTLRVLRTFTSVPQGDAPSGVIGHKGLFYHFLDPKTGFRFQQTELSTIDTALLMMGVLFAREYYNKRNADEKQIRELCTKLLDSVEWPWFLRDDLTIGMGWHPESGMIPAVYEGYTEAGILYLLAIGARKHAIPPEAWNAQLRKATFERAGGYNWFTMHNDNPLFCYQYPHCWVDFRGIRDDAGRKHKLDWFQNSRRAALAQHRSARENPNRMRAYSALDWGLTACDGPGDVTKTIDGREVRFMGYSARGLPGGKDDGTIAPTAALSSLPYAPKQVLRTMRHWLKNRPELFNRHGFADAFNPTFDTTTNSGWIDPERLAIDQGPIVIMIENYRSGFVWDVMRRSRYLKRALRLAGFKGGWLA